LVERIIFDVQHWTQYPHGPGGNINPYLKNGVKEFIPELGKYLGIPDNITRTKQYKNWGLKAATKQKIQTTPYELIKPELKDFIKILNSHTDTRPTSVIYTDRDGNRLLNNDEHYRIKFGITMFWIYYFHNEAIDEVLDMCKDGKIKITMGAGLEIDSLKGPCEYIEARRHGQWHNKTINRWLNIPNEEKYDQEFKSTWDERRRFDDWQKWNINKHLKEHKNILMLQCCLKDTKSKAAKKIQKDGQYSALMTEVGKYVRENFDQIFK